MADKKPEGPKLDPMKDLWLFIVFLVVLGVLWYVSGGPSREWSTKNPFLNNPIEFQTSELEKNTDEALSGSGNGTETIINSTYKNNVELNASWGAKETNPQKEYVEITASSKNEKPIVISNWRLKGKQGLDIKLGTGTYLIFAGQVGAQNAISLNPGEKAIIVTGKSPLGTSFKLNKCTGYFEQFQDFVPSIPRECVYPKDEDLPNSLNDFCLDYIDNLPRCEVHNKSFPVEMQNNCIDYITSNVTYNSCVTKHKADSNFYNPEWRIYLGRTDELWKEKRETVTLYDENNKIIDQVSY